MSLQAREAVQAFTAPKFDRDRTAAAVVLSVLVLMTLFDFYCIAKYASPLPRAEDWLFVPPLTGNEPAFLQWLWAQNGEHRGPIPRLIQLGLLKLSHGDYRLCMVFNVLALAGISARLIQAARKLRGSVSVADAFFPIAFLNLGEWENIFWGWELSFILPVCLICCIMANLLIDPQLSNPRRAIRASICLFCLPLCSAIGVVFAPLMILYFFRLGWQRRKIEHADGRLGIFLMATATVTAAIVFSYFIRYDAPFWNLPSPGLSATLFTIGKFLAYGLGPGVEARWNLAIFCAAWFFGLTLFVSIRSRIGDRALRLVTLLLIIDCALMGIAVAYGRSGFIASSGFAPRYAIFATPLLCLAYFLWEIYGSEVAGRIAAYSLLAATMLVLPRNTAMAYDYFHWNIAAVAPVHTDLIKGISAEEFAVKYVDFFGPWWSEKEFARYVEELRDAQIGDFRFVKSEKK